MIAAFLESGEPERLYRGLSLLVSAAADGRPARGLAGFGALAPLLEERLHRGPTPEFAAALADLRAAAAELPDLRIWACSAAVELTGADRALIDRRLDGVMSTPRFLRETAGAELVVV